MERDKLVGIVVEEVVAADIDQLACFEDPPLVNWQLSGLQASLNSGCRAFKISENQVIRGYCLFRILVDEVEILDIIIKTQYRGKGLGKYLLGGVLQFSKNRGCLTAWLEVRKNNTVARQLYADSGFEIHAIRKNYYTKKRSSDDGNAPKKEDALVMRKGYK